MHTTQQSRPRRLNLRRFKRQASPLFAIKGQATSKQRGFTVIELMIVLTVTAALLVLATPNLRGLLERNVLLGQANEMAGGMALARSEAVSRGVQAGVCASDDNGVSCGAGWTGNDVIVFIDENNNGAYDGGADGERVLKVLSTDPDLIIAGAANQFLFRANGFGVLTGSNLDLQICHERASNGDNCRTVQIRPSGIVSVVKSTKTVAL